MRPAGNVRGLAALIYVVLLVLVVAALLFAVLFATGFFSRPEGDDCPAGECPVGEESFWVRFRVTGDVVNPLTINPAAPIRLENLQAACTASAPPEILRLGGLNWWAVNYDTQATWDVTYPSGATYEAATDPVNGNVPSGGVDAFEHVYYRQGPAGTYRVTVLVELNEHGLPGSINDSGTATATCKVP